MSLLIPAVVLAIVLGAVFVFLGGAGAGSWVGRRTAIADEHRDPATPTLDYAVPAGQDPVVVLTALSREGYAATADPAQADLIHISTPAGPDRDRARVRATIAAVRETALDTPMPMDPGEVRFTDER
jgi:hypothetical protein